MATPAEQYLARLVTITEEVARRQLVLEEKLDKRAPAGEIQHAATLLHDMRKPLVTALPHHAGLFDAAFAAVRTDTDREAFARGAASHAGRHGLYVAN